MHLKTKLFYLSVAFLYGFSLLSEGMASGKETGSENSEETKQIPLMKKGSKQEAPRKGSTSSKKESEVPLPISEPRYQKPIGSQDKGTSVEKKQENLDDENVTSQQVSLKEKSKKELKVPEELTHAQLTLIFTAKTQMKNTRDNISILQSGDVADKVDISSGIAASHKEITQTQEAVKILLQKNPNILGILDEVESRKIYTLADKAYDSSCLGVYHLYDSITGTKVRERLIIAFSRKK